MVGAERRLATDAVVMKAKDSHVMYVGLGIARAVAALGVEPSAGTSMVAMQTSWARWCEGGRREDERRTTTGKR